MKRKMGWYFSAAAMGLGFLLLVLPIALKGQRGGDSFDQEIKTHLEATFEEGKRTFRFDTFGDETFWGDTLKLHRAIEGQTHGGVGAGVSPKAALGVGLKVDADA